MDSFKQYLRTIAPISDREFEETLPYFKQMNLSKGDIFVNQVKICRHIAFIVEGTLRTYYINENAEETTSCFCTKNNFSTSYKSFILQQPSQLTLQAIENTQLLVIDYESLQKLYVNIPVWQTIGRVVSEKEYIVLEKYASILNNETAKEKYIRFLKEQPNVLMLANVEDIASYLGITRRTLSRIRKEIKDGI